jgi:hypothetical protein
LFVGVFDLEKLIEFLAGNFEWRRHDSDRREDGLIVGPDEEDEENMIENQEEKCFYTALDVVDA